MKPYTSEQALLRDAQTIQDACNPVAIADALTAMYRYLTDVQDTEYACNHPAVKAVIGKLASLAHIDHSGQDAYSPLFDITYSVP